MCMRRSARGTLLTERVAATMTPRREDSGWVFWKPLGRARGRAGTVRADRGVGVEAPLVARSCSDGSKSCGRLRDRAFPHAD
jgi:hypothetical protein